MNRLNNGSSIGQPPLPEVHTSPYGGAMDMRIQSYRPVTVQSFSGGAGGQSGRAVAVTDARQNGPVPAVSAISSYRADLATLAAELRQASGTGYTDTVRGSKVNILA